MRLVAATLKNYRLHREVTVAFDPSRTLIGGPNEAGKSTLVEGIHRGLFLKAKGTGLLHKSMVSTLHGSHPEVEVRFEAGGREYTVRKRFSGQSGTTQLVQTGGPTWQGEDAEDTLTSVLGSEGIAGRATAGKIDEQWAHLWVWQGMAGSDPVTHLRARQDDLLRQLQEAGGSVARQSALDGRVAARCSRARDQIFVKAGSARAGSDLDRAGKALAEAQSARDFASARLTRLEEAMAGFENAQALLERTQAERESLRTEREALTRREREVARLRQRETEQQRTAEAASEKLAALETAERTLRDLRTRLDQCSRDLAPQQETLQRRETEMADLKGRMAAAEQALDQAQGAAREARLRGELANAIVRTLEVRSRQREVGRRLERVRTLRGEIAERQRQLHALPSVDRKRLSRIQKLEGKLAQATASLTAMAAEVEILAADAPVRVGERNLAVGDRCTLTESALIGIGDGVRIRIHPGGGDRLEEAREAVRSLREAFRGALEEAGLESLEEGAKAVASREHLEAEVAKAGAALEELDGEGTERAADEIQNELSGAEAEVTRRRARVEEFNFPASLEDARAQQDALAEACQRADEQERVARSAHEALRKDQAARERGLTALRAALEEGRLEQTSMTTRLNLLLETHGADAARGRALEETRQAVEAAKSALAATREGLAELQPELLPADQERLERATSENNRLRELAQTDRAVFQNSLRSDGSEDPKAALAEAEARLQAAREHHAAVSRKAAAIALVDELFQREQRALADRFSRPLADRITGYLQCLFGPGARAEVGFAENAFKTIELIRPAPGGALAFEALSGGTREQVAAAVRLAIAELLAADFGGTLPVVFDDAFAYADPERVQTLQRMLDLAAGRGLQIIVLSCNPSDYAGLGARQVSLATREPERASTALNPART
jgi:DNA repair exonuclease SbcCD ATPase subunit